MKGLSLSYSNRDIYKIRRLLNNASLIEAPSRQPSNGHTSLGRNRVRIRDQGGCSGLSILFCEGVKFDNGVDAAVTMT